MPSPPSTAPLSFLAGLQDVVSALAPKDVGAAVGDQGVGAFAALKKVVAGVAVQDVVGATSEQVVVAARARQGVGTGAAGEDVAGVGADGVVEVGQGVETGLEGVLHRGGRQVDGDAACGDVGVGDGVGAGAAVHDVVVSKARKEQVVARLTL